MESVYETLARGSTDLVEEDDAGRLLLDADEIVRRDLGRTWSRQMPMLFRWPWSGDSVLQARSAQRHHNKILADRRGTADE